MHLVHRNPTVASRDGEGIKDSGRQVDSRFGSKRFDFELLTARRVFIFSPKRRRRYPYRNHTRGVCCPSKELLSRKSFKECLKCLKRPESILAVRCSDRVIRNFAGPGVFLRAMDPRASVGGVSTRAV